MHANCTAHRFPPHLHTDVALGVVASGSHKLFCASGTYHVAEGDVVVLNAGEVHRCESVDGLPWSYRMFHLPERTLGFVTGTPGGLTRLRFPAAVIRDRELAWQLACLHQQLGSRRDGDAGPRLVSLLLGLATRYAVLQARPPVRRPARPHQVARAYLETHFAERIRISEVSRISGVSVFHLIHAFKQAMGLTPGAYLRQIRIARAQALLRSGRPVAEVARATAWSDQSHFTRRFKQTLGFPPGAYLRAVRSESCRPDSA